MPRPPAPCGSYPAYRRHLRKHEAVDAACRKAQREHDSARSTSAPARAARQKASGAPKGRKAAAKPPKPPAPLDPDAEGHISRLEVLKELLQASRETIPTLKANDPARVYLQMREQREIIREIAELQGNGQAKGVTLVDQLAEARARREADAATAAAT